MTPETEAVLHRIGWDVVKRASPLWAAQLASRFASTDPSSLSATDAEARRQAKEVEALFRTAWTLWKGLEGLPEPISRSIALASICRERLFAASDPEEAISCHRHEIKLAIWQLMAGFEATQARLLHEGDKPRRGNPRNLKPHAVAFATAQIYLVGRGEMPTANNGPAGQEVTGLFGRTVEALFGVMGLGFDVIGPARSAVKKLHNLDAKDLENLKLVRCPVTREAIKIGSGRVF